MKQEMSNWKNVDADHYVHTISSKVPGYELLYELTEHILAGLLGGSRVRLLVLAAGGGQELVTLGTHQTWELTGVDTSGPMLKKAKERIEQAGILERVKLIQGTINDIDTAEKFDGATCILMLHFLKTEQEQLDFLRAVYDRLKPGSPFVIAGIFLDPDQNDTASILMEAWHRYMQSGGVSEEEWSTFAASLGRELNPIPSFKLIRMLEDVGFSHIECYFRALHVEAYCGIKAL